MLGLATLLPRALSPVSLPPSPAAQLAIAVASLGASLEALGACAFVVRDNGIVVFSNALGRAALAAGTVDLEKITARSSRRAGLTVAPFVAGGECLRLVVVRRADDLDERLSCAHRSWSLTAAQLDVLSDVVTGVCNKDIAARRGCSFRTVEVHVTALFAKSGSTGRTELTAKFWTLTD